TASHICILSLHDALPIYFINSIFLFGVTVLHHDWSKPVAFFSEQFNYTSFSRQVSCSYSNEQRMLFQNGIDGICLDFISHVEKRSEEHTSELQSRENLVC